MRSLADRRPPGPAGGRATALLGVPERHVLKKRRTQSQVSQFPEDIFTEPETDPDTLAEPRAAAAPGGRLGEAGGVDINPKAGGARAARVQRAHRAAADRPAGQRAAALLRPALPHPHPGQRRGRHLPRPGRLLAVGAGHGAGAADADHPARPGGDRRRTRERGCHGAGADRHGAATPTTASARPPSWSTRSAPTPTASR